VDIYSYQSSLGAENRSAGPAQCKMSDAPDK
jgi:hypothetical protein